MADEDDGLVVVGGLAHQLVQDLAAALRKGGGGLIDHEHLGIVRHGLGDLDQLALLHVVQTGGLARVDVGHADLPQGFVGRVDHLLFADDGADPELVVIAQKDVFGDGDVGDRSHLLHDDADARVDGFQRRFGLPRFAFVKDLTAGRLLDACNDGGDGGFARAVLPDQAANLAPFDLHVDMIQGYSHTKMFAQILYLNKNFSFF